MTLGGSLNLTGDFSLSTGTEMSEIGRSLSSSLNILSGLVGYSVHVAVSLSGSGSCSSSCFHDSINAFKSYGRCTEGLNFFECSDLVGYTGEGLVKLI